MKLIFGLKLFISILAIGGLGWFFYQNFIHKEVIYLKIGTGGEGGTYNKIGKGIAKIVTRELPLIKLEPIPTGATVDNSKLLYEAKVDFGLMLNDYTPDFADLSIYRSIAPIYQDVLHIIVKKKSGITTFIDNTGNSPLNGKSVYIGRTGSGTERFCEDLFQKYNIHPDRTALELSKSYSYKEAIEKFKQGEIDALFFMLALGEDIIKTEIVDSVDVSFLSVDSIKTVGTGNRAEGFLLQHPHTVLAKIPKGVYGSKPEKPVLTFAVPSVLVTTTRLDREIVRQVTKVLFENKLGIVMEHPQSGRQISENFNPDILQFPLHEGAQAYFNREEPGFFAQNSMFFLFSSAIVFLWIIGLWGIERLEKSQKEHRYKEYDREADDIDREREIYDGVVKIHYQDMVNEIERQGKLNYVTYSILGELANTFRLIGTRYKAEYRDQFRLWYNQWAPDGDLTRLSDKIRENELEFIDFVKRDAEFRNLLIDLIEDKLKEQEETLRDLPNRLHKLSEKVRQEGDKYFSDLYFQRIRDLRESLDKKIRKEDMYGYYSKLINDLLSLISVSMKGESKLRPVASQFYSAEGEELQIKNFKSENESTKNDRETGYMTIPAKTEFLQFLKYAFDSLRSGRLDMDDSFIVLMLLAYIYNDIIEQITKNSLTESKG